MVPRSGSSGRPIGAPGGVVSGAVGCGGEVLGLVARARTGPDLDLEPEPNNWIRLPDSVDPAQYPDINPDIRL